MTRATKRFLGEAYRTWDTAAWEERAHNNLSDLDVAAIGAYAAEYGEDFVTAEDEVMVAVRNKTDYDRTGIWPLFRGP